MVGTISPVVYRNSPYRQYIWVVATIIYTFGSVIGGGLVGAFLGLVGTFALFPMTLYRNLFPLLVGLVAIAYSLHELDIISLPHPERKRQVPSYWRNIFHPYITAGLFGFLLGAGFTTFIPTASYYILGLGVTLYGSPIVGILIFFIYGAARASLMWFLNWRITTVEEVYTVTLYMDLTKPIMRQVNGFALAASGTYLLSTCLWPL